MPATSDLLAAEMVTKLQAATFERGYTVYQQRRLKLRENGKLPAIYVVPMEGILDDLDTDNRQTTAYPFAVFLLVKESALKATDYPDMIPDKRVAERALYTTSYTAATIEFISKLEKASVEIEGASEHVWWTSFEIQLSVVEDVN